jgi:tripartite-type tricarboxylate transporter receptor subunit TctC
MTLVRYTLNRKRGNVAMVATNAGPIVVAVMIALTVTPGTAGAEDAYPSRPITMVVPIAPGGGLDAVARLVGRKFSEALRQPVVIDNRAGGSQNIGIRAAAKATADGYTLLYSSNTITINPALFSNLGYDVNADLIPIGKAASLPLLIVGRTASPYKSLPELIAYAKANPQKLSYGSPGTGTPHHLGMELLKSAAGADIVHVPYKGAAPGLTDLIGGNLPLLVTTAAPVQSQLATGELRAYATLDATRLADYSNVPTVGETLPGFEVGVWHGVFAPAATPPAIAARLTRALEGVVKDQELAAQLNKIGVLASWASPAELRATIKNEQAAWATAIKKAGLQVKH